MARNMRIVGLLVLALGIYFIQNANRNPIPQVINQARQQPTNSDSENGTICVIAGVVCFIVGKIMSKR